MDVTSALDECLARLATGESADSCLASYPHLAGALGPMLSAAQQVHVLQAMRLSQGQRLRAKVALRETLAGQRQPRAVSLRARPGAAPLAALLAVVLFMGVTITAVAGSQPGDLGYAVRVVVERAPAWVQVSNEGRASAELAVAERRLYDVATSATESGEVPPAALDALVRGVEAAANRGARLPEDERAALARRVSGHADELMRLADSAGNDSATALRLAAQRIAGAASKLHQRPPEDQGPTPTVASMMVTPTSTRTATSTVPVIQVTPVKATPAVNPSRTPRPRPTLPVSLPTTVQPPRRDTPVIPTIVAPTLEPSVVAPTREPRQTITPPRRMTPPPVFTVRPTRVRPTVEIPTVVIPTRVRPTRAVPTIVAPTIEVPTVRPTRDLPQQPTKTPEATRTVTVAGEPETPTPTTGRGRWRASPVPAATPTTRFAVLPTPTETPAPTAKPVATLPSTVIPSATPASTLEATYTPSGTPGGTGVLTGTATPRWPLATALAGTSTSTAETSARPTLNDTPIVAPTSMPTRPPRPR